MSVPPPAEAAAVVPPPEAGDDGPVRGEIFSLDRLGAHAVEVARAHGEPSLEVHPRPLLARFQITKKAIERTYQVLADLNTRPRTTYVAAVLNPNKELEETPVEHG